LARAAGLAWAERGSADHPHDCVAEHVLDPHGTGVIAHLISLLIGLYLTSHGPVFHRIYRHAWWVQQRRTVPAGTGNWLRGNGWVLASIVEVLEALPVSHDGRELLSELLGELASAVVRYQLPSGLFPTTLGRASYEETSGSALVAYALFTGLRAGSLTPALQAPASRAYRALLAALERRSDGPSMPRVSTATMPYPAWAYALIPRVRDPPHGIAALILAGIAASFIERT
jgi:rhamnogalacturonyl hydrolase YesR